MNNSKKTILTVALLLSSSLALQAKWYDYTPLVWLVGKSKQKLGLELLEEIRNQEYEEEIFELLEKNPDVNVQDERGATSLMLAIYHNNIELAQKLIEKGADTNIQETLSGLTALMITTETNSLAMTKLLLKNGAEINQQMILGFTALTYAVIQNRPKLVAFLLEEGADPNVQGWAVGLTPLILAASEGYTKITNLLLEYGANPNIPDFSGKTAIDYAKEKENPEIMKMLTNQRSCSTEDYPEENIEITNTETTCGCEITE